MYDIKKFPTARLALAYARARAREAKINHSIYNDHFSINGRLLLVSHWKASDGSRLFGAWQVQWDDESKRRELKL